MVNKRILKKMGFLADQQGTINRYLREQGGWDSHLYRCRDYILRKVKLMEPNTVTVLGSGWLLDLPLEELAGLCRSLKLVDINHPRQILRKVRSFSNVELIRDDITGGVIEKVWDAVKEKSPDMDLTDTGAYSFDFDPGLVISLNILTQTDTLLNDYLVKNTDYNIDKQRQFRKQVQQLHLDMLDCYPHLLITDYLEEILDIDSDKVVQSNKLVFADKIPAGRDREEWDWIFDSAGEYYRRKRVVFKVMATDNSGK